MLEVQNLEVSYGAIRALKGVSLSVGAREIVTLIGANGAGKSTLLRTISGLVPSRSGRIVLDGRDITRTPAHRIVQLGICQVPEGRGIFPGLSVRENLDLGGYLVRSRSQRRAKLDRAYSLFPILKERSRQRAGTLSGGEQQMLAIGRALMAEPRLLLLDEPSLGLAPFLIHEIFATIRRINQEEGIPILLVEQNANMALATAARGYVLETGQIVLHDTCVKLREDPRVQQAYLGEEIS